MKTKTKIYPYLLITSIAILMVLFLTPGGHIFGSDTDWFSQHVQIADTLRTTIYDQGIFPNFVDSLGGGQNVYAFSYYGLFRPDVLLSLLLPMVAMKDIVIVYMVISFIASLNLLYYWLKQHDIEEIIAFVCTMLFAFSSFFFQIHRQIMFVNYMPYLILSLITIDRVFKGKSSYPLVISIVLIILHSFFFSVSCAFVLILYILYTMRSYHIKMFSLHGRKILLKFFFIFAIAFMICGILLLPTLFVLLSGERGGSAFDPNIFLPNITMKNLLYDKYGMGLTLITCIALSLGLKEKKIRELSLTLILCLVFTIVCYVLNGTLYTRIKVFLPFIPLILYIVAHVLQSIQQDSKFWMHPVILLALLPLFKGSVQWLLIIDGIVVLLILCLYTKVKKNIVWLLVLVVPMISCWENNQLENYVSNNIYNKSMSIKSDQNLKEINLDQNYRFDDIRYRLQNVNLALPGMKRTTMYTSMNNQAYNEFFYDIAGNAIPTRNRVITTLQENVIFQEKMGVRYLYTNKDNIPKGYNVLYESNGIKLLENKDVLPIAYVSNDLYSEASFDKLSPTDALDVLYNRTIVNSKETDYKSTIKPIELSYKEISKDNTLDYQVEDGTLYIKSDKKSSLKLNIDKNLNEQMLIIKFDVKNISNIKTKDLTISINNISNKLSSKKAAYPNGNTTFTYILSSQEVNNILDIDFSKGTYELHNVQVYTMPYHQKKDVVALQTTPTNAVLEGDISVEKDSYFVTSLPIQKGYEAYVDGEKQKIETVNKAFVGFPIDSGKHTIKITFTPPGKIVGGILSAIGLCGFVIIIILERRKANE